MGLDDRWREKALVWSKGEPQLSRQTHRQLDRQKYSKADRQGRQKERQRGWKDRTRARRGPVGAGLLRAPPPRVAAWLG